LRVDPNTKPHPLSTLQVSEPALTPLVDCDHAGCPDNAAATPTAAAANHSFRDML
jgi:hypothetical protein